MLCAATGDFDGNGTVGQEDYDLWRSSFGSTEQLAADGNDNGVIDAGDYTVWRDNFGAVVSCAPGEFNIIGPTDDLADSTPTVDWDAADSADNYDLVISLDPAGNNVVQSYSGLTDTFFELTTSLAGGTYYSQVVANSASGSTDATNNGLEFTIREPSIDAVYFAQTHVMRTDHQYFGLVSNRDALIKVHVVAPGSPTAPDVYATLSLDGQTLDVPLTGPETLPASIADGPGVVQHSFDDSFTAIIPAEWMHPQLDITVNADTETSVFNNLYIGAPTEVDMTMFDIEYFSDTTGDYPTGTLEELEAKWPVADLEVTRVPDIVFPELVIPARAGAPAVRVSSPTDYLLQTGLSFDGEQAAALAWNGALRRAAGRAGFFHLSYVNIYGVPAGGQAGGWSGVGNGTSAGILHHELGHAAGLPHWGNNAQYPYKGDMFGIQAPENFNETHAGPTWAFDLPTMTFIPPTVQPNNVGGHPAGTYKVDPMQGGGTGRQEPEFILNHFSDYSVRTMQEYIHQRVVVWNDDLFGPGSGGYAKWDQGSADYSIPVANNGVLYPVERDVDVITVMASIQDSPQNVNMVYPPIGAYKGGLINLFDPRDAGDRAAAISAYGGGQDFDVSLRIMQGGVEKIYMLPANWDSTLRTEAVNLPAADGEVTRAELIRTPDAQINGLPANPEVLYTWSPLQPDPAEFQLAPVSASSTAIGMSAVAGTTNLDGLIEYYFTETSGNPGGDDSGWQFGPSYTDTGLQAGTEYTYTVTMRVGAFVGLPSDPLSATTLGSSATEDITVDATQQFTLQSGGGLNAVNDLGSFDAAGADKLVVVISTEHGFNNGQGFVNEVRYNGQLLTEAVQEDAGPDNGTAAIFYLDNPGSIGAGTIEVSAANPNGGIGAAYALSGTAPDFGVTTSITGNSATSLDVTTIGDNSTVIAVIDNAGTPNSSGTPTLNAPFIEVSSGRWGSQWGGHASGYIDAGGPGTVTASFNTNTGSGYSINIAAVEILAAPIGASANLAGDGGAVDAALLAFANEPKTSSTGAKGSGETTNSNVEPLSDDTLLLLGTSDAPPATGDEWDEFELFESPDPTDESEAVDLVFALSDDV